MTDDSINIVIINKLRHAEAHILTINSPFSLTNAYLKIAEK